MDSRGMVRVFLTGREQHLAHLRCLKRRAKWIDIVIDFGGDRDDPLIVRLAPYLGEEKQVNRWPGTLSRGKRAVRYRYPCNEAVITELKSCEAFFITDPAQTDRMIATDFGMKDIAFYDRDEKLLFYTTTHEGLAYIRKDLRIV